MKLKSLLFFAAVSIASNAIAQNYPNATGIFKFDDESDLWKNEVDNSTSGGEYAAILDGIKHRTPGADGSDYTNEAGVLDTDYSVVTDGANGKAVKIETGNFLYVWHGLSVDPTIQVYSTGSDEPLSEPYTGVSVNKYSVVMDVRFPDLSNVYTLFEVNPHTTGGGKSGEVVVRDGMFGADTGPFGGTNAFGDPSTDKYSTTGATVNTWHRVAYVADVFYTGDADNKVEGTVKIYLDGVLINEVFYGSVDGSASPYGAVEDGSGDDTKAAFKVSGNNEGSSFDNQHDIDNLIIFDTVLTDAELTTLGSAGTLPNTLGTVSFDASKSLKIYPNPTSDFLSIEVIGKSNFKLINSIGQTVISKSIEGKTSVDVRGMKQGLYFVQVQAKDGKISTAKVILK